MQVAPSDDQILNQSNLCHHLVKFATNARGAIWWPNLQVATNASGATLLPNLVTESISGSVVLLAMFHWPHLSWLSFSLLDFCGTQSKWRTACNLFFLPLSSSSAATTSTTMANMESSKIIPKQIVFIKDQIENGMSAVTHKLSNFDGRNFLWLNRHLGYGFFHVCITKPLRSISYLDKDIQGILSHIDYWMPRATFSWML